ncbi:MAG: GH25 family lysozyme [Lachnospira sp.]|nr:GH25 family lysozyme [Lachnospira sp.]
MRVGHGHGENWADAYADTNMDGCEENGIPYGVYYYSEATNEQEATLEANNLIERLKGRNPQLGVFVDVEATDAYQKAGIDPYKDGDKIVELADRMLSMIKKAGYVPGIYANTDYFDNVLYPASHFYSEIRWVARYYNYNSNPSDSNPIPEGDWDIWQYGSTGSVAGIDGNVDLDVKLTEPYDRDYNNIKTGISYRVHVQDYGDQAEVKNGASAGTTGESKRLEAIWINLSNSSFGGSVAYRTQIQNIGWEDGWKTDGQLSGTTGQSLRLEAIQIKLTGDVAEHYDIYYRVHAQNFGWLGWAENGEPAGTEGCAYRLEAIEIQLVDKGGAAPGSTENAFRHADVSYTVHVQNIGWQSNAFDGQEAGTTGRSLRLEGIRISIPEQEYSGSIQYRTHIQNTGWENDWKENGQMSGTIGQALRLEAIQIQLTGEMAEHYDIFYRCHAQNYGWLGWAKNGEPAGTAGYSYRLEAIEIQLIPKGGTVQGTVGNSFYEATQTD